VLEDLDGAVDLTTSDLGDGEVGSAPCGVTELTLSWLIE